jgi:hypothetical protein
MPLWDLRGWHGLCLRFLVASLPILFAFEHMPASQQAAVPPASESELLDIRDRQDVPAMRKHAWGVYVAITKPSDPRLRDSPPIWDTWEDKGDLFAEGPPINVDHSKRRQIDLPIEVLASIRSRSANEDDAVRDATAYVRQRGVGPEVLYNPAAALHIRTNGLNKEQGLKDRWKVLKDLNAPISESSIVEFPRSAIVVKAMWLTVGPRSSQVLQVWDPPNKSLASCEYGCSSIVKVRLVSPEEPCNLPALSEPVFSSCFYNVPDPKRNGYRLVLFGLHIATKEIRDWTWSTFWWQRDPENGPYARNRPDKTVLEGYWRNYVMDTTLSMVTPEEKPRIGATIPPQRCQITPLSTARVCFNPYLELGMKNGELSNCVNCHRQATYPAMKPDPRGTPQRGYLSSDDRCFGTQETKAGTQERVMKVDYLWSLSPVSRETDLGQFLLSVQNQLLKLETK